MDRETGRCEGRAEPRDLLLVHLSELEPALLGVRAPLVFRRAVSTEPGIRHRTTIVEHAEGRFVVRRPARAGADLERERLALLAIEGRGVGPRPLHLGSFAGEPFLILEHLPGREVSRLGEARLRKLAALLLRLHEAPATCFRGPDVLDGLEEMIDRLPSGPGRERLTSEAVRLRRTRFPRAPHRLLHGDVQRENLIAHRGELRLIDFEAASLGDPAFELVEVIDHLGLAPARASILVEEYVRLSGDRGLRVRMGAWEPVKRTMTRAWAAAAEAEAR